ncbi:hypothetical protein ACN20G_23910 [Streptomyces sp. BI20]|uniref:hypothetical protein n=1 Tax=Streptomyces sp. BI20 TaxID=3403460 RepID=UPI003C767BC1
MSGRNATGRDVTGAAGGGRRPLWVEQPEGVPRMPDPVRRAAVRAVLIVSVTLILASVAFLLAVSGAWSAFPVVIAAIVGTILSTWGVLDVWITRQGWRQRHGVHSVPSSAAREDRGARRAERRAAREAARHVTLPPAPPAPQAPGGPGSERSGGALLREV